MSKQTTGNLIATLRKEKNLTQAQPQKSTKIREIIALVLCGVPLAMGIAVVVLNSLGEIDGKTTGILLGIGLFCLSLYLLDKNDKDGGK